MEKVLFNLLSNAFKFTPDGGTITLQLSQLSDTVCLLVENSGKGIAAEDLPFIFDRFHKFEKDYSGNDLGSGIGLALVKKLVELHHGSVSAESQPGALTRFVVELPKGAIHFKEKEILPDYKDSEHPAHYALLQQHSVDQQSAADKVPSAPENAPQLLLIEDNDDVRRYLKQLFRQEYRIVEAADGRAGWELALQQLPDLIISDIMMPELDGLQFCKKVKTTLETSHIPVILLTARTSLLYRTEGLETGADDYITKPFDATLLKLRVKNLILSRKRLREKFGRQMVLEPHEVVLTTPDQDLLQRA
ncbi:MAG: response regulator, partial [Sinomicrobium sp.]|nr:response regulator [Sinomicrobium sp.]